MISAKQATHMLLDNLAALFRLGEAEGLQSKEFRIARNKFAYQTAKLRRIIHAQQVWERKVARKNRKRGRNG